jgi:hypothetical protein
MTFAEVTFKVFHGFGGLPGVHGVERFFDRLVVVLIVDELILVVLGMQRLPFVENRLRRQPRFAQTELLAHEIIKSTKLRRAIIDVSDWCDLNRHYFVSKR